jgi:hypothetical protein
MNMEEHNLIVFNIFKNKVQIYFRKQHDVT